MHAANLSNATPQQIQKKINANKANDVSMANAIQYDFPFNEIAIIGNVYY